MRTRLILFATQCQIRPIADAVALRALGHERLVGFRENAAVPLDIVERAAGIPPPEEAAQSPSGSSRSS